MKSDERVFVCGGGHQGLSMSAHLALNGVPVSLWNRSAKNIQKVLETHEIHCSGVVNGVAKIDRVSCDMDEVISDFVMVATPSSAHRDLAKRLAPYVHRDMVVILNPGRTFGAVDFLETLKSCHVSEIPHVAETQTIVYTCRRSAENETRILALKNDVKIAAAKGSDMDYIMSKMPACLRPYFSAAQSVGLTSLSNVGMVLHCAPVLMNVGWIETDKADFKYYYDGISPSVSGFLEKIDNERISVARAAGFEVESVEDWLRRTYLVSGSNLYECIHNNQPYREIDAPPTIQTRYLLEDVPNGLVPIEFLGECYGIPTPNISTIINLAASVLNKDFRAEGRRFSPEVLKQYL